MRFKDALIILLVPVLCVLFMVGWTLVYLSEKKEKAKRERR